MGFTAGPVIDVDNRQRGTFIKTRATLGHEDANILWR